MQSSYKRINNSSFFITIAPDFMWIRMSSIFRKGILIAYGVIFCCLQTTVAQDYNFSQFWENRTYYNPAFTGLHMGEFNSVLTYRKLWPRFGGNFSTIFFSGDLKTYNNYGMGLYVVNSDESGGSVKATTVGLSYSWRGYISKERGQFFQLGIKGSYNHENLNFDKYIFTGQLHPIYGNIYQQPSTEGVLQKQNFWDFSFGAIAFLPIERSYTEFMQNYVGFSLSHFTRPKNNFIENKPRIPMKFNLHWNSSIRTSVYSLDKKNWMYVNPGILFENVGDKLLSSSSFNNVIAGADLVTDPFFGGVWYSSQLLNNSAQNYKAIIFKLGLKFYSENKKLQYRIAYTYDMSTGNLTKSTDGSHEISINVVYRFNAKYMYNIFSL